MKKLIVAMAVGLVGLSPLQASAEGEFSLDTEVAFYSDYMFRGVNLYDGTSIQPSVTATYDMGDSGAIAANVWNHNPAESDNKFEKFNEVDYTLSYSLPVDNLTLSGGLIWYTYSNDNVGIPDSEEFFVSAALDTTLNPSLTFYRDYEGVDEANYFDLTFSEKLENVCGMGEGFNITPYLTLGFASDAEKVYEDNGLVHTTIGVSTELALGDVSVVPSLNYNFESDDVAQDQFFIGFTLGYSFI